MKIGCPNCGGNNIKFIPEKQVVYCDHCKQESPVSSVKTDKLYNNYDKCNCSSCGFNLIVEENTIITVCPYCGSNQIVKSKFNSEFRRDKIIPFKFGHDEFVSNFADHFGSNELIPDDFLDSVHISDIKGIYVPFKMVNIGASAITRGTAIDRQINTNDDGPDYDYYYKLFDMVYDFSSDIVYDVSTNVENINTNSVGPFDYEEVVDFNPTYLCDFSSEMGNDKEEKDLFVKEILNVATKIVNNKIQEVGPGDKPHHVVINMQTKERRTSHIFNGGINEINFRENSNYNVLLPIWFFQYKYKNKTYSCLMNGQTGKIVGNVPLSKFKYAIKLAKIFTIPALVFGAIIYLFTKQLQTGIFAFFCIVASVIVCGPLIFSSEKKFASNITEDNLNNDYDVDIKK